jgi:translation initiation factor IF-2
MSESQTWRLNKVAKEFNVGIGTIVDYLADKGYKLDVNPNSKIDEGMYNLLAKEYAADKATKEKSVKFGQEKSTRETITIDQVMSKDKYDSEDDNIPDLVIKNVKPQVAAPEVKAPEPKPEPVVEKAPEPEVVPEPIPEPVVEKAPEPEVIPEPKEVVEIVPEVVAETKPEPPVEEVPEKQEPSTGLKVLGKMDLTPPSKAKKAKPVAPEKPKEAPKAIKKAEEKKPVEKPAAKVEQPVAKAPVVEVPPAVEEPVVPKEVETIRGTVEKLEGFKVLGKMELPTPADRKPGDRGAAKPALGGGAGADKKGKRKRIKTDKVDIKKEHIFDKNKPAHAGPNAGGGPGKPSAPDPNRRRLAPPIKVDKAELTEEQIQKQVKETLARLGERQKNKSVKFRRDKRDESRARKEEEQLRADEESLILRVTEFVSANELSSMMEIPVTKIISSCMSLGLFVSINQRLDAETISIIAEEFGYTVEFVTADAQEIIEEEADLPEDLVSRPPVVTVMGHVDHGKTSLLDYVRKANVIAGEAGGITQHIGAYGVQLEDGKQITFIDTPGHEAFTAMRARGAKVTDVAIIVIAADDSVMPQTREAINHAQAAGVPMVFAFNKIDKTGANPEKIREALAGMNLLVEEWGGKYQAQEVSAKSGLGMDKLLEKVLLEAEMLDLKANPDRNASGTVIEATLDKGRGFVCTVLVQNGTLKVGDVLLAGPYSGRVKAMYNERSGRVDEAGPSVPVRVLGLSGAPQAGDTFNVMNDEKEAREIATKRQQILREQGFRTRKHLTLDDIGRRIAIGDFKQLNLIIKGDTDGSVEALSDSLLKLSTEKIQVNIIHKAVGAISEGDVLLASASDAIMLGFNVRPMLSAKKLAEKEEIDIRHYSIIYKAIEEIKTAMEGMLSPDIVEKVTANVEVRNVFKITKVGTVAGCYVLDGKISRNNKVRIIRDGIVVHTGEIDALKRFKDDVKEVNHGYECGMSIKNFSDLRELDIIEAFEEVEVKAKL